MKLVLVLVLVLVLDAGAADQSLAPSTVVIYNKASPDSVELAKFYAQQRGIPRENLIPLTCSTEEEISREEYDGTIAEPIRTAFKQHHWWTFHQTAEGTETVTANSIQYAAVIKGVPLRIRATTEPYPADEPAAGPVGSQNQASVDSELSVLALFSKHISGAIPNPYFQSYRAIGDFGNPALLLVGRLDAPAASTVRRMIVDAIAAEKSGLWGRGYVDGSHNAAPGSQVGDTWLAEISQQLHRVGIPIVYDDSPALFPDGYPMTNCALYYGWYAGQIAGPFNQPDFRFVTGAIAVHIHSFSANTLRDPNAGWVGPLISRGAAASVGNVYEPFLQLTAHLDIFNDRLLHGFTLAESAYMSIYGLSWMSVVVGDPLYRPYASWLQIDASRDSAKSASNWRMYHEFAVKYFPNSSAQYRQMARQAASRARNCPMIEDIGLMEAHDGNFPSATSYFQQARACYTTRDDILRVVLEETDALVRQNKSKRALELVRSVLRIVTGAPSEPLLRKTEQDLGGAPSTNPPVKR
ncbi:MAG: TIGR03790 family protein [Verrucomicrobiota bacterium]|nr:TIGR03790 family protein [Verrucomicrobiota bacterium]